MPDDTETVQRPHVRTVEAAKLLKVSVQRVRQLLDEGKLKGALVKGVLLIDPSTIDAYARSPRKGGFPYGRHRAGGQRGGGRMLPD